MYINKYLHLVGDTQILGLTGGGQTLNIAKKNFFNYLKLIVDLATLQTSYLSIDAALKITNRRVNALEYIVIPRIQFTINYIDTELQERAKEEKFKIKKVLENKKKHKENELVVLEEDNGPSIFEEQINEEDEIDEDRLFDN